MGTNPASRRVDLASEMSPLQSVSLKRLVLHDEAVKSYRWPPAIEPPRVWISAPTHDNAPRASAVASKWSDLCWVWGASASAPPKKRHLLCVTFYHARRFACCGLSIWMVRLRKQRLASPFELEVGQSRRVNFEAAARGWVSEEKVEREGEKKK